MAVLMGLIRNHVARGSVGIPIWVNRRSTQPSERYTVSVECLSRCFEGIYYLGASESPMRRREYLNSIIDIISHRMDSKYNGIWTVSASRASH